VQLISHKPLPEDAKEKQVQLIETVLYLVSSTLLLMNVKDVLLLIVIPVILITPSYVENVQLDILLPIKIENVMSSLMTTMMITLLLVLKGSIYILVMMTVQNVLKDVLNVNGKMTRKSVKNVRTTLIGS